MHPLHGRDPRIARALRARRHESPRRRRRRGRRARATSSRAPRWTCRSSPPSSSTATRASSPRRGRRSAEIDVDGERLLLGVPLEAVKAASLRPDELSLVDALLDNQVLDMRRRAFVRVQDVVLEPAEDHLVVAGVDASSAALARRFGLGFLSRRLPKKSGDFVPWSDVNLIALRLSRLNFVEAFARARGAAPGRHRGHRRPGGPARAGGGARRAQRGPGRRHAAGDG